MNQNNLKIKGNWNNEHLMTYSHIVTKNACQWLLQNTVKKKTALHKVSFCSFAISCSWHLFSKNICLFHLLLLTSLSLGPCFSCNLFFLAPPFHATFFLVTSPSLLSTCLSLGITFSSLLCLPLLFVVNYWVTTNPLMDPYGILWTYIPPFPLSFS